MNYEIRPTFSRVNVFFIYLDELHSNSTPFLKFTITYLSQVSRIQDCWQSRFFTEWKFVHKFCINTLNLNKKRKFILFPNVLKATWASCQFVNLNSFKHQLTYFSRLDQFHFRSFIVWPKALLLAKAFNYKYSCIN